MIIVKKVMILIVTFILTGLMRIAILCIPFKYIVPFIGEENVESDHYLSEAYLGKIRFIQWAISFTSRFTPWESKCLVQALTSYVLLSVFRVDTTLYLGLKKDVDNKLLAHAWLRAGQHCVTGGSTKNEFIELSRYGKIWGAQ